MITDEMVEAAARAIMQDEFFVAGQPAEPVYRMARAALEAAEKVRLASLDQLSALVDQVPRDTADDRA
jgi:hypothetical protein